MARAANLNVKPRPRAPPGSGSAGVVRNATSAEAPAAAGTTQLAATQQDTRGCPKRNGPTNTRASPQVRGAHHTSSHSFPQITRRQACRKGRPNLTSNPGATRSASQRKTLRRTGKASRAPCQPEGSTEREGAAKGARATTDPRQGPQKGRHTQNSESKNTGPLSACRSHQ